jgi:Tfp pilus assembly protein FimV
MVAVAHHSPAQHRRLVVVRSAPVLRLAAAPVSPTTYRRRRAAVVGAVAALLLVVSVAVQGVVGPFGGGPLTVAERPGATGPVYVVQPGDTFWDIARMLRPDEDPRPLVSRLVAAHGSPVLRVGERIHLPGGA